jgi:hypothetical protein
MLPVVLAAGAATVILAMTFAGTATGQASTSTFITVDGAAFTPDDGGCAYTRGNYSGKFEENDGCDAAASIQLPDKSTITGIWVFYDSQGSGGREFHFEESDHTGDHNDIVALSLPDCTDPEFADPCFAAETSDFSSPDVLNQFFGYAGWLDSGDPGFIIYRILVRVSVPSAGGARVNPPSGVPNPSKNP